MMVIDVGIQQLFDADPDDFVQCVCAAAKATAAAPKHDVATLAGWKAQHASCGRGPWHDVDIGVYRVWKCSCGSRFTVPK